MSNKIFTEISDHPFHEMKYNYRQCCDSSHTIKDDKMRTGGRNLWIQMRCFHKLFKAKVRNINTIPQIVVTYYQTREP